MSECKKCGTCCKVIYLPISPEKVEAISKDTNSPDHANAKFVHENWIPLSTEQAREFNPFVVSQVDECGRSLYYYSCTRLDSVTNLCTVHDSRPQVCVDYPWYGRPPHPSEMWYTPDCGYVRDYDEWVKNGEPTKVLEMIDGTYRLKEVKLK